MATVANITFKPLSRNRYEVIGTGLPNNPRIKKAQIRNFRNSFFARLNRRTRKLDPNVIPTVSGVRSWMDVHCPGCDHILKLGKSGLKKCSYCGTAFNFISARY